MRAGPAQFLLLGMSHHTAPLALRERYAVSDPRPALARLLAAPEIHEALLLSTCNRVEALVWTADARAASGRLRAFFGETLARGAVAPEALSAALYEARDSEAVRRFFRVAASLDSMVVGEPQILGQVKQSYRAAVDCGACGPMLERLCQRAFATAKRVRSETRIAEGPVSVARVAVQLAGQIFESLAGKTALLVGAGEMIELALEALDALQRKGLAAVSVANRTLARASALAARFGVSAHDLSELPALLLQADILFTCIDGELPAAPLSAALRARRRPLFAVDLGFPRNIPPALGGWAGAGDGAGIHIYDLDDLQRLAEQNARGRGLAVARAEDIVADEQRRFSGWLAAQEAAPTIRALCAQAESIRSAEMERALAGGGSREALEAVTRAVVNKLLHAPLSRLRAEGESAASPALLEAARALFGLDGPEAAAPPPPPGAGEPTESPKWEERACSLVLDRTLDRS